MENNDYFTLQIPANTPQLKPEVETFMQKFPKRSGQLTAKAIAMAKKGDCHMLNLIRSQRLANADKFENEGFFEENIQISDGRRLRVRIYNIYNSDAKTPKPAVIYLHGGGWTIGAIETCTRISVDLARDYVVIVPEYRLAPEHPYPCALNDTLEVLHWTRKNADTLGVDREKIAVAGDSSGGHLAITAAIKASANKEPMPSALVLFYPVTSMIFKGESWAKFASGYALDAVTMDAFNDAYCDDAKLRKSPTLSPLDSADIKQFPPTLLVYSSHDILRDQSVEFAKKLKASNVMIRAKCIAGAPHIFITMPNLDQCYNEALAETREFLKRVF